MTYNGGSGACDTPARRARRVVTTGLGLASVIGFVTVACDKDTVFGIAPDAASMQQKFAVNTRQTEAKVLVNEVGYLKAATKVAVVDGNAAACAGKAFSLKNSAGSSVLNGTTSAQVIDPGSGDKLCKADFSAYGTAGTGYYVSVADFGDSEKFSIVSADPYPELYENAIYYFTYHRLGSPSISITLPGSLGTNLSRSWPLRAVDGVSGLTAFNGWAEGSFFLNGSWADAGDLGVYGDNAVQSIWVLGNLQEYLAPNAALAKVNSAAGNLTGTSNLLAELEYGARALPKMLPPDGYAANANKLAAHKCHDDSWATQPWGITASSADVAAGARHCMGPSVTSTYAVVRASAMMARLLASANSSKATEYWNVAKDAWRRANLAKTQTYNGPSPGAGVGGGDYPDTSPDDDRFAAAVELYLTARVRADSPATYEPEIKNSAHFGKISRRYFDWEKEYSQGNLSLLAWSRKNSNALDTVFAMDTLKTAVTTEADAALTRMAANGFPNPIDGNDYPWGSNKVVVHSQIIMAYAYDLTGNKKYLKGVHQAMDYLMGINAVKLGFVSGYGTNEGTHKHFEADTHDRQANGNTPRGWLVGGPINASDNNDPATPTGGTHNADNYANAGTFANAWGSKENTIDWNAPLAWVSWYVRAKAADLAGDTVCTPSCAGKACGSDGCGGVCGTCAVGKTCNADGTCSTTSCTPSCSGKTCGPDGCGASCGTCSTGYTCNVTNGTCLSSCTPNCTGRTCGSDGCGGLCGTCTSGKTCLPEGTCATPSGGACDGLCTNPTILTADGTHPAPNAAVGCLQFQGSIGAGSSWGMESRAFKINNVAQTATFSIPAARNGGYCIQFNAGEPSWANYQLSNMVAGGACTPSCSGKTCGPDGCGGICGTCAAGTTCGTAGTCIAACTPACGGKQCGADGCGGVCGSCTAGHTCNSSGLCVAACTPNCSGKTCGPDGCGGLCGTCTAGQTCSAAGTCSTACTASCSGKVCGSDGCGGSCGTCASGQTCNTLGQCQATCTPNCTGKTCGSNGCGGQCGTCASGTTCDAATGTCKSTCVPACPAGAVCGSNGCGGSCGTCAAGTTCSANQLSCVPSSSCTLATATEVTGTSTGNFNTTGSACYKTAANIGGWGCSNEAGRTIKVNGVVKTCGGSISKSGGYYLFEVSPGTYPWASIYWW